MAFDNPYFPQIFDVGTPNAGHMHFAADGSQTLYGPDGVTVLFKLDPVNGMQVFKGDIGSASGAHIHLDPATGITFYAADGVTIEYQLALLQSIWYNRVHGGSYEIDPNAAGSNSPQTIFTSAAGRTAAQVIVDNAGSGSVWQLAGPTFTGGNTPTITTNSGDNVTPASASISAGLATVFAQSAPSGDGSQVQLVVFDGALNQHLAVFKGNAVGGVGAATFTVDGSVVFNNGSLTVNTGLNGTTFPDPGFVNISGATGSNSGGFGAALQVRTPGGVVGRSPALFHGIIGQTGNLTEWQDGSGNQLARIGANGEIANGFTSLGGNASNPQNYLTNGNNPGNRIMVMQAGSPTQSADFIQWQNSAGGRLAGVTGGGVGVFQNLQIDSPVTGNTAAAGGNGALPATVGGYLNINLGGTVRKIPYYV